MDRSKILLGNRWLKIAIHDIDPTVFIDDDGQAYMYWGNPDLYYIKLNEDMVSYSGEIITESSKPDQLPGRPMGLETQ